MSKYIKVTDAMRAELLRDFEKSLANAKLADGKVTVSKTFTAPQTKASLYFTPAAFAKMIMLVQEFSDEVAWHGMAFRGEDPEKHEYFITDIMVYPQEVTGATVNTDQEKYQTWLMEQSDEVFPHIRMQGHSHVNMATSPSSVDLEHQGRILEQLDDDMFYIFIIWNKRMEHNIKIYDLRKNILFEPSDITVSLTGEGVDFDAFIADAKSKVARKTYVPVAAPKYGRDYPYESGPTYNGYYKDKNGEWKNIYDDPRPITKPVSAAQLAVVQGGSQKKDEPKKEFESRPRSEISAGWDNDGYDEIYGQQRFYGSGK